jgi:proteasome lid subunit RPN8/RPN11
MKPKQLLISTSCKRKLLRWALLSKKEIAFLACAKQGQSKIIHVHRLRNVAAYPYNPRSYFFWNEREVSFVKRVLKKKGLRVIIEGHSHPAKSHPSHPSKTDVRWLGYGMLQIIVAPFRRQTVTAWKMKATLKATLKRGQIPIVEI